jgi:chromosome segregation ATPase
MLESDLIRLNSQILETENENLHLKKTVEELTQELDNLKNYSTENIKNFNKQEEINSQFKSKIQELEELVKLLSEECEEFRIVCSEKQEEILSLKELVDKDRKNNAIKELSYIILSKEHNSPESPIKIMKNNNLITEVFENKIRSLEQESQEFLSKYRNVLFKYIDCLKEFRETNNVVLAGIKGEVVAKEEIVKGKLNYLDIEIEFSEFELEKLECEEISYYTSFGESPCIDMEGRKSRTSGISISLLLTQAAAIESLLTSNS